MAADASKPARYEDVRAMLLAGLRRHHGFEESVRAIRNTWERILAEWLPGSGFASAQRPDFEVYDQRFDPRSGQGAVEIWIDVRQQD